MKSEFLGDNQDHHSHSESPNMFAKLQPPPQLSHHPFQEHADSPTTTNIKKDIEKDSTANPSSHDGASIEVIRRPRGRPPGSRNKPKPPIILTRESEPPMSPYVFEISPNIDIIETVTRFCNKRAIGLCILSGSGAVANVTLRQPSSTSPSSTVTFHGRFDILSISATLFPNNNVTNNSNDSSGGPTNGPCNFTISLAGPQGQVFGGPVVGPLASAGIIYLIAATFTNPCYQRLPLEEESRNVDVSDGGGGRVNSEGGHQSPSGVSGGGGDGGHRPAEGMDMYSLPSDVIWAPTARQPQPPHPPY